MSDMSDDMTAGGQAFTIGAKEKKGRSAKSAEKEVSEPVGFH